jgi:hypothetical protein
LLEALHKLKLHKKSRKICVLLAALPHRNLRRFYARCIMQHFPAGIRGVNTFCPRRCINSSCIKSRVKSA